MNTNEYLEEARRDLENGRYQEAISIYQMLIAENGEGKDTAAYCLGIICDGGIGVPTDPIAAERYYSMAENGNQPLATYRLGKLLYRNGDAARALTKFKKVAETNPSAAYWSYYILSTQNGISAHHRAEKELYLNSAANQGHLIAMRINAVRKMRGLEGILKIPWGVIEYFALTPKIWKAVARRDDFRYQ